MLLQNTSKSRTSTFFFYWTILIKLVLYFPNFEKMNPCISNAKTLEEKTTSSQFIISKGAKSALACSDNSKEWLQAICFLLGHRMKIQLKPILSLCICVGQFFTMVTQIMNMGNSKSKFEDGNVAAPSKRLGKNGRFWLIEWVLISIAEHASKYPVKSPQCFT